MKRIVSCFTNCYGESGVWTAAARINDTGIDHLELALRGHNFGGLVIPESAVITEKADDKTAQAFCDHLQQSRRQDQRLQRRRGRYSHRRRGRAHRAAHPVRRALVRASRSVFPVPASRPTPPSGKRSSPTCAGSAIPPASAA